ncbi:MAG TPA: metal-dependent transcriptional regulator [Actinomycetota bacterium]|nr:metal-dependent transcriptional regulator [Actinomycetota bacterium]
MPRADQQGTRAVPGPARAGQEPPPVSSSPVSSDREPELLGTAARDYLQALYEMEEEGIPTVRARLAAWMGVTLASVSEAVKRLVRDGLVREDGRRLELTEEGGRLARVLVRRHRLAEHFLIRVLGLPWHRAHDEASRWERAISSEVEARMVEILGDPGTCPHGNPIPGSANEPDLTALVSLTDVPAGERVILRRLTEDLELDLSVMRFFEESGLLPGAEIRVVRVAPDGTRSLEVAGRPVALGPHLADNVWVELAGEAP